MAYPGQQYDQYSRPPGGGGYQGGWNIPSAPGFNPPIQTGGPPPGGWGPPAGPPPGNAPGWGPPPQGPPPGWGSSQGPAHGWGPPPGPPPMLHRDNSGKWPAPTGPPPHANENTRPYPGSSGGPLPPQNYQQAQAFGGPPGAHFQPGQSGPNEPYFQYSACTGKRKALCIGINYIGTSAALHGCHNDAVNMQRFLTERYGYKQEDIVVLMDVQSAGSRQVPTRANIIEAMRWLVRGAQCNDSLFFHYSGHGGQAKDQDGDEADGYDETILPLDYKSAGEIVDDEMYFHMVAPLPAGCRLTAVFDSCHSGTALDLPYVYSTEGKIKEPNILAEAGQDALKAGMSYLRGDLRGMAKGLMGAGKQLLSGRHAEEKARATRTSPADAIQWSGCKDNQTSADATEAGKATGAMSWAYITALSQQPNQTYQQLLVNIRQLLADKYSQKPQLSSSHPIDTNLMYVQ